MTRLSKRRSRRRQELLWHRACKAGEDDNGSAACGAATRRKTMSQEPTGGTRHSFRVRVLAAAAVAVALLTAALIGVKLWSGRRPAGEPANPVPAPDKDARLARGEELFLNSCAGCHGEKGDGAGPAARFLYPKPRDFTQGKFRLVTTVNHIPSDDDLLHVITRGMPGSAMFPFGHLSEEDRRALVAYVRHLTRTGVEAWARQQAAIGGEVDEEEIGDQVKNLTTPGDPLEVPADLAAPSPEAIARGQARYPGLCAACHGKTGKGDGTQDQRDDNGMPIQPRDFTRGIFKGGRDPRQLYARIMIGIPGGPMPGSSLGLVPADAGDLINFILSLSNPASQEKVEHRRTRLLARRSSASLGEAISQEAWNAAESVHLVVSPLWWRNYAEPDLHVQALHDGQTLVLRLTWQDETRNDRVIRPQDFEDMAAVQLFKGSPEPFLGMGAAGRPVDVWLWRAGAQSGSGPFADMDTAYPNMAVDMYPFEKTGNGPRPHAPEQQPRDFLTAEAAGNQRADPAAAARAASHQATGFGSLTMRPSVSQLVKAWGEWKDGRWTVVLRRPLQVDAAAGLPLAAGDKLSIAFALWDGAAGDRNGQKLVSIWHDLELE
jgi:mono/diheme cytochrome c family protein